MSVPAQVVILAGGEGTRLRPLTHKRAKPVVPLLNRPFLAYQLALLRAHGVSDVILACSYRVDDVRAALGDARDLGVTLRYVVESEPLGTGGGLRHAADLDAGTIFVLNGDVLTDADLGAMRAFHERRGARATIYLTRVTDPRQYGLVETERDGRVRAFREKPTTAEEITTDTINAGIYLLDAALVAGIPAGRPVSIERETFPALITEGVPVFGWIADAYWRDIGTPAAYRAAQVDLLDGNARLPLSPAGARRDGAWLAEEVAIAPDACLAGPSVVGRGARLEAACHVGPYAVVGEHAVVGRRATLKGAILWERVQVGADATLTDCVIGADVRIGAGARIGGGVVLESGAVIADGAVLE